MVSYVRSSNVHGILNRFLEWGCIAVFDDCIFYSRASLLLLFPPFLLPYVVIRCPLSMIMSMY